MKWDSIRVSTRTTRLFGAMRASTGMTSDVLARFSLCLSLGQRGTPNPDEYNEDGSTLAPSEMFGGDEQIYMALVLDRLREDGLDPKDHLGRMTRAHINRGAIGLRQRVGRASDFERLAREAA
ncbi:DNA sulfur modification protein DndE [Nitrosopumilaceae archaeon]|nr:DNA sulfur modification protein DndE [Nitrosopumilaceae archaeon]